MTIEMKALLKLVIKEDILFGSIIALIIFFINPKGALIFLLGIIIAMLNFVIRGIILDKSLNAGKGNVFSVVSTFIRISTVIIIALIFANNKYHLLLYLKIEILSHLQVICIIQVILYLFYMKMVIM